MPASARPNPRPFRPNPSDAVAPRPTVVRGSERPALVTIGIPAYRRPELLREALASLSRQRGFSDFEVVVCDDGGLPETRTVIEASPLPALRYYLNQPPLGAVGNWNRCIELARAPWVTVLHEDDLLYPWFLKHVTVHLRDSIAAVAVRCDQGRMPPAEAHEPSPSTPRPYPPVWFLKGSMTPFPGVVFSRQIALDLGGFDPRQGGLADYAFWYALACAGGIDLLRESAAFYRVNDGQWTETEWPAMLRRAHLLRLRVAREQMTSRLRLGRWIARFYTARMARAYGQRFDNVPVDLRRARRFEGILCHNLPSGWVWALLERIGRSLPRDHRARV